MHSKSFNHFNHETDEDIIKMIDYLLRSPQYYLLLSADVNKLADMDVKNGYKDENLEVIKTLFETINKASTEKLDRLENNRTAVKYIKTSEGLEKIL